jgi:hypothetical protein
MKYWFHKKPSTIKNFYVDGHPFWNAFRNITALIKSSSTKLLLDYFQLNDIEKFETNYYTHFWIDVENWSSAIQSVGTFWRTKKVLIHVHFRVYLSEMELCINMNIDICVLTLLIYVSIYVFMFSVRLIGVIITTTWSLICILMDKSYLQ